VAVRHYRLLIPCAILKNTASRPLNTRNANGNGKTRAEHVANADRLKTNSRRKRHTASSATQSKSCSGITRGENNMNDVEYAEWSCYLFGGEPVSGIVWRPLKGHEPNWFWRWMQFVCFGNRWIKDK
jgi:hypothetical protein